MPASSRGLRLFPRNTQALYRLSGCFLLVLFSASRCQSQFRPAEVPITPADTVGYTFLDLDGDTIENSAYLAPVFQKLYLQRAFGGRKITVVHLGDSHVLGNFMTAEVRRRLQEAFGDAGRGLVFPYKLAGSNGPLDYLVQSPVRWQGANCVRDLAPETTYGVSGFRLEARQFPADLTVRLRDTLASQDKLFTKLSIFYHSDNQAIPLFTVRDPSSGQTASALTRSAVASTYYFHRPAGQFTVTYDGPRNGAPAVRFDGFSLENEMSGVVYHSIGVNGGKFTDFLRARYFARQLAELQPDLIILSFGTNEAQARPDSQYLTRQIDELVRRLQAFCPHAHFLLTTPADSYLRGKGANPHMRTVSNIIRRYARSQGYALWDLYALGGGLNSARYWKANGLLSTDSVHYSRPGYAVQGKLLYQSLISGYNAFIRDARSER
jgi:lysophospholipase L1-like esterase